MRHKVAQVRLQVCPHVLRSNALVQEYDGVGKTGPAEPNRLGHPLLDLLQIMLQDLGCDLSRKLGGELRLGDVGFVDDLRVSMSGTVSVRQPFLAA
jgi:hypothetical protein